MDSSQLAQMFTFSQMVMALPDAACCSTTGPFLTPGYPVPCQFGKFPRPQELGDFTVALNTNQQQAYADADTDFKFDSIGENGQFDAEGVQARAIADDLLLQLRTSELVNKQQDDPVSRFLSLSFASKVSCRAAQLVLEEASSADATQLAWGLQGHVRRAVQSKFANYVLQKIVEILPIARLAFVVEELQGFANGAARHRFGCRILCRILEHTTPGDRTTDTLIEELLAKADELCSHAFGSYVIRHILEFGLPEHKHRVTVALLPRAAVHAKHKLGSHVVEAALQACSQRDQLALVHALLSDTEELKAVASNVSGRHVVLRLLSMGPEIRQGSVEALLRIEPQLRASKGSKDVLQALYAQAQVALPC